jgi:phage tail sheath protein FI
MSAALSRACCWFGYSCVPVTRAASPDGENAARARGCGYDCVPSPEIMAVEPVGLTLETKTGTRLGIHPIPFIRRTVAAFIGRSERGPVNEPVEIESFDDFRRVFGGQCSYSFLPDAVQHYFQHGGQAAVVVRVVNRATRGRIDVPAEGQFLHLQARNPGAQEFLRVCVDYDGLDGDAERFNLVIQRLRNHGSTLIADQEIYPGITMRHSDPLFVVDALQESNLVRVSAPLPGNRPNATVPKAPGEPIPYIPLTEHGTDGEELTDYDVIGSNQEGTGLFALEHLWPFDLLCIPGSAGTDLGTTAFIAAERYCERRRAVLICDPPAAWTSVHSAVIGMRNTSYTGRNAMLYFPRIRPRGEGNREPVGLPACGAVAGMLARRDLSGVWTEEPTALKASFTPTILVRSGDATLLGRFGINALAPASGGNATLVGNVTLGGANAISTFWQRLDRRRLFMFILKSIEENTAWVRARLDAETSVAELDAQVRAFLNGLLERGALAGASPRQAFSLVTRRSAGAEPEIELRLGLALGDPSDFLIHEIHYGVRGIRTRQVPGLEAERLLM